MADPKPKKTTKDGLPFGRPTKYKPEYCKLVIDLGRDGKSIHQISAIIDVAVSTIYLWAEENQDFSEALMRSRELAQAWYENQAEQGLWSKEFNHSLWAKIAGSRFRDTYSDKTQIEHSGQIDSKVSILDFSNAE
jgi:hypothetical protein